MEEILVLRLKNDGNRQKMVPKQIPIPRKMLSLVEDRHKKRDFLIRSSNGSIQNQKEAKLPNSHKWLFLIFFFLSKFISFYSIFVCLLYTKVHTIFTKENLKEVSKRLQIDCIIEEEMLRFCYKSIFHFLFRGSTKIRNIIFLGVVKDRFDVLVTLTVLMLDENNAARQKWYSSYPRLYWELCFGLFS